MITLSSLDEVTKYLEQHDNAIRLKKLILCACKNIWENDPNKLNSFNTKDLIQELININLTIDDLKTSLSKIVKSLNKQAEYSILASIIFNNLQKLYQDKELTQVVINPSPTYIPQIPQITQEKFNYNAFEVRQEIMKYTNPLRAKILIFSTLYDNFSFNDQDWLSLREYQIDDLLQLLFQACPNLKEFEYKLQNTATSMQEPNENIQAATALVQAIRPYYSAIESNTNPIQVNNNFWVNNSDDSDLATCQFLQPKDIFKKQ